MLSVLGMLSIRTARPNAKVVKLVSARIKKFVLSSSRLKHIKYMPNFRNSSLPEYRDKPFGSQFYPASPIEVAYQKIETYLLENNPRTFDEWHDAKDFFYTEIPLLSDVNYSSVIMDFLLKQNKIEVAHSFMKYLHESHMKPNILTYLQYMSICGRNIENCGQEVICETFNKIQHHIENAPVLDKKRASYVIQGLCSTDKWRTSFDYLKKLPDGPSLEVKNSLAFAAIRNGDEALAWEIVTRWLRNNETISSRVIKEFLKYANNLQLKNERNADIFILKFFKYMEQKDIVIQEDATNLIAKYFNSHSSKWNISYTKVGRTGECDACGRPLKFIDLSNEEFTYLKDSFLEKSLKKKDIFINTTREEFSKYIAFIERHKPFHIVIDGLNVAYTVNSTKNPRNLSNHLLHIVKHVSSNSKRVLVMGRKHMAGWPSNILGRISRCATVFLTSNISQDDPFTLYAALASGPHTYILTMDLMRDHMSRLDDPKLIHLFKKWQQSQQILLNVDQENNFKIIDPIKHSITLQGDMESGWHIPVEDNIIREPYEELNNWMCIQKKII